MLCSKAKVCSTIVLGSSVSVRALSDADNSSKRRSYREKASPHFPLFSNEILTEQQNWPHKNIIDKLITRGEEREAKFLNRDKSNLRYREHEVLMRIKQPGVKRFIDSLEEKYLDGLVERREEFEKLSAEVQQMKKYPDCLMGLDPFSYIREEESFAVLQTEEAPLGTDDIVSTGSAINKTRLRTPVDLAYLAKNEGVAKGTWDFLKTYFTQGKAAATSRYVALKNRGYDHGISDRTFSNKTLALHLQSLYLKHFELIANRKWNILLDYMADNSVAKIMKSCVDVDKQLLETMFSVRHVSDNSKPVVLSHLSVPYEQKSFLQALVRFDMKVECFEWDQEKGRMEMGTRDMLHYVVFERDTKDFLSKYRIIEKVSEEDLIYHKRHKRDTTKDTTKDTS